MIQMFKIMKGIERIDPDKFFKRPPSHTTRGHWYKIFKPMPRRWSGDIASVYEPLMTGIGCLMSFLMSSPLTGLKRVWTDTGWESIMLSPRWNERNAYNPKLTRSGITGNSLSTRPYLYIYTSTTNHWILLIQSEKLFHFPFAAIDHV